MNNYDTHHQLLCDVCGDKASGQHYGAETCEGCKGFFRRSLDRERFLNYSCERNQNCEINSASRKNCRYCRYQKCQNKGMSRDRIKHGRRSNKEKEVRKRKSILQQQENLINRDFRCNNGLFEYEHTAIMSQGHPQQIGLHATVSYNYGEKIIPNAYVAHPEMQPYYQGPMQHPSYENISRINNFREDSTVFAQQLPTPIYTSPNQERIDHTEQQSFNITS